MDASLRRADQLAPLKQGPPADESVPPFGQTAGVRPWEPNLSGTHKKEQGTIYFVLSGRNGFPGFGCVSNAGGEKKDEVLKIKILSISISRVED
jgi:hypothetical protein